MISLFLLVLAFTGALAVDTSSTCTLYGGTTGNCDLDWCDPINDAVFPEWGFCNRRPTGTFPYAHMDALPPANLPAHVCGAGVLNPKASGIICTDYSRGDGFAGPCTDAQCCVPDVCSSYTCVAPGYTPRVSAANIACHSQCNDALCCTPPAGVPRKHAQGIVFVDRDPQRHQYGGTLQIIRAVDESDITHYHVYWGFAQKVRSVPACSDPNPVVWDTELYMDPTKRLARVPKTGFDITIDVPMDTTPDERCPLSTARPDVDPCNPPYFFVVSVNANGEKDILDEQSRIAGPRHPIADYEGVHDLPCAESGVTMGRDRPHGNDVMLGTAATAAACARLCREYTGPAAPCRYWSWVHPSDGELPESCWLETQTLQRVHSGNRVVGPAVCPTPAAAAPTGRERPRCERWVRTPGTVPYDLTQPNAHALWESSRDVIGGGGRRPNADACQAVCDQDPLCIGFLWMREQPSDASFHTCWIMHADTGARSTSNLYDLWSCSRDTMAPHINGYTFRPRSFGYLQCSEPEIYSWRLPSHDCCASRCDADPTCTTFTYWGTGVCTLYAECGTLQAVDNVPGCAYESCYDGFGAATYSRQGRNYEIVDRWPSTFLNADGTVTISVQTNTGLNGQDIVCTAARNGAPLRPALPGTAEAMLATPGLAVARATVTSDVATLVLPSEASGAALAPGQAYTVRCALLNADAAAAPRFRDGTLRTRMSLFYSFSGNGICDAAACPTQSEALLPTVTLVQCLDSCAARADCFAAWYDWRDSSCHMKVVDTCNYDRVRANVDEIECWQKDGDGVTDPYAEFGTGVCTDDIGSTCHTARRMGVHTQNDFVPFRAVCPENECQESPCPAGQTCNDPDQTPFNFGDFVCTCDSDTATSVVGGAATCVFDECGVTPAPCGNGQTCNDPDTRFSSRGDFVCTCNNDVSITARGARVAQCVGDECAANPCGNGQTCDDPNTSAASRGDFVCTCNNDAALAARGSSVRECIVNECVGNPCGNGQTCDDPNMSARIRDDFVCTCDNDAALAVRGSRVGECIVNECAGNPCGNGQTCDDPNTSARSRNNFVCTCNNDAALSARAAPVAVCVVNECSGNPCRDGQTCDDPNNSAGSTGDFRCVCNNDRTVLNVAAPVPRCVVDECEGAPCGERQTCADPNKSAGVRGDFICTCVLDNSRNAKGQPANCVIDECLRSPCGEGQTCADPDTVGTLRDYYCTCNNDLQTSKVGGRALCTFDECDASPCGAGQTCKDLNPVPSSRGDYRCACEEDEQVFADGERASCELNECATAPCGEGQVCREGSTLPTRTGDYTCICLNDASVTARGAPATCGFDECTTSPCGAGATCVDSNQAFSSRGDFVCFCVSDETVTATGKPPVCNVDECEGAPCGQDQVCTDQDTSISHRGDFLCTCAGGLIGSSKEGGPAVCSPTPGVNECEGNPCGAGQSCTDQSTDVRRDFVCSCTEGVGSEVGAPALCVLDECAAGPCGTGQTCTDPMPRVGVRGDYVCRCPGAGGERRGAPAVCGGVDECAGRSPCRPGETCSDPTPNQPPTGDYVCTPPQAPPTPSGECFPNPCREGFVCIDVYPDTPNDYFCAIIGPAPAPPPLPPSRGNAGRPVGTPQPPFLPSLPLNTFEPAIDDDDGSDSMPWWVWLLIGLGACCLLVVLAMLCRKSGGGSGKNKDDKPNPEPSNEPDTASYYYSTDDETTMSASRSNAPSAYSYTDGSNGATPSYYA